MTGVKKNIILRVGALCAPSFISCKHSSCASALLGHPWPLGYKHILGQAPSLGYLCPSGISTSPNSNGFYN